ncbi:hypothetical protein GCM10011607_14630 [Shewanella inventionis]|uniref:Uncharacterized protein n=2 Tax=Shewanella inventionis TaxID=1738770 RepID=A0ABQ1IXM0_9GAMM|nr:hypothetical protein GCM10011607_14630 [Shewanella inventionis]
MASIKAIIHPVIIIILALIIRFFLSIPFIDVNGEFMSTNEIISHSDAGTKAVTESFLSKSESREDLVHIFNAYEQTKAGDIEVFKEAFDVVASIADLIIIITVFFVLPVSLKRKA